MIKTLLSDTYYDTNYTAIKNRIENRERTGLSILTRHDTIAKMFYPRKTKIFRHANARRSACKLWYYFGIILFFLFCSLFLSFLWNIATLRWHGTKPSSREEPSEGKDERTIVFLFPFLLAPIRRLESIGRVAPILSDHDNCLACRTRCTVLTFYTIKPCGKPFSFTLSRFLSCSFLLRLLSSLSLLLLRFSCAVCIHLLSSFFCLWKVRLLDLLLS